MFVISVIKISLPASPEPEKKETTEESSSNESSDEELDFPAKKVVQKLKETVDEKIPTFGFFHGVFSSSITSTNINTVATFKISALFIVT